MAKQKKEYVCSGCSFTTGRWAGCCPSCNEWNTFTEHIKKTGLLRFSKNGTARPLDGKNSTCVNFESISTEFDVRIVTNIGEWDRVLGGGILPGSFLILTGDPGIGKSTLLLQIAHSVASNYKTLYFSSEESLKQIKKRALRLGIEQTDLLLSDQAELESIIATCLAQKPNIVIIDSIQNCFFSQNTTSTPGSISMLKEAGFALMQLAKQNNIALLITGHITKDGHMAGPKVLEHMVDAVFYLQGADQWQTRLLRSVKNRFGTVNELGFFHMQENGLQEIADINQHLIGKPTYSPGSALTCELEGSRPLLLEIQALCVSSKFAMPQRVITGIDPKRVMLIAAILEKYLHIKLSAQDIFFKVTGGVRLKESASDLSIALALLSSYFQKPLPEHTISLAEVSLSGLIKPINHFAIRQAEATKFGIKNIYTSKDQKSNVIQGLQQFKSIYELLTLFPEDES